MTRQVFICEAGLFWRRVLRRFQSQVNNYMKAGYRVHSIDIIGRFRLMCLAVLETDD